MGERMAFGPACPPGIARFGPVPGPISPQLALRPPIRPELGRLMAGTGGLTRSSPGRAQTPG